MHSFHFAFLLFLVPHSFIFITALKSIMQKFAILCMLSCSILFFAGCKKEKTPKLIFKFKFDPTLQRLNNFGQPAAMPSGHAGQNPDFNKMSAHYIELATGPLTPLGSGTVLYHAAETNAGGATAIDFSKAVLAGNNEMFYEVPLSEVTPGDYEYLRVSLAYQNFDVKLYLDTTIAGFTIQGEYPGTVASFVGYNTYINNFSIKNKSFTINDDKLQGFWGYEMNANFYGYPYEFATTGQAPPGATTVPNPLSATSPIPAGSCVVTGPFGGSKLQITGNETEDIVVVVALSTNKSFEWIEVVNDGKWEPSKGEVIVDMGLRGLWPYVE